MLHPTRLWSAWSTLPSSPREHYSEDTPCMIRHHHDDDAEILSSASRVDTTSGFGVYGILSDMIQRQRRPRDFADTPSSDGFVRLEIEEGPVLIDDE
jgi:hypothetical protein